MAEAERSSERIPRPGMTPLQKVAMGIIVIALDSMSRYDTLPDPIGWALVLWGIASLPMSERRTLLYAAGVAGAVSIAMWFPQVHEPVHDQEVAVQWAASLPDLVFIFLLSRCLARQARSQTPPEEKFAGRFGITNWATVIVALMPPVADAAASEQLLGYADIGFVLLWIWLVWNLFAAHNRPFVGGHATKERK